MMDSCIVLEERWGQILVISDIGQVVSYCLAVLHNVHHEMVKHKPLIGEEDYGKSQPG
jgi:hypothetical protein